MKNKTTGLIGIMIIIIIKDVFLLF